MSKTLFNGSSKTDYSIIQGPRGDTGPCLLYTSDAADERSSVDLGGRRIIKKKTNDRIMERRTISKITIMQK